MWGDTEDAIIGGDLTAALAYLTPAGGAVVTPVAPLGLRDRDAGTVSFTTSLGFGRKLDRVSENPRGALAYHAREHGFARDQHFVLVQGTATYDATPDRAVLEQKIAPAATRFMGAPKRGVFWDRWLSAYYADRVIVTIAVERVLSWADPDCTGAPEVFGARRPQAGPDSQEPPAKGTGPRVDSAKAARRAAALDHALLAWRDTDGLPMVAPVRVGTPGPAGIALNGSLPPGARRAGMLAHSYRPQLIGLKARQHTGWLGDGVYAPHTENGIAAPANKTLLLLANGLLARRGLAQARKLGRV